MAKELPFFKFEPSEWDNGLIQACEFAVKGVFIDLCAMYWSRTGDVPYAFALQKLCRGDASAFQVLSESGIISISEDDQIIISFLDRQLNEFSNVADKRRKAAEKRWKNANALQTTCKSNAFASQDKIREDKIREDKNTFSIEKVVEKTKRFSPPSIDEVRNYCLERKNSIDPSTFLDFYASKNWMVGKSKMKDWKASIRLWERRKEEERFSGKRGYKSAAQQMQDFDARVDRGEI